MSVKLNLNRPAIVIAGTWNPAIFSVPWVLDHLFQVPKGEAVEVGLLEEVLVPRGPSRSTILFREVGICPGPRRVEFSRNTAAPGPTQLVEQVAVRAVQTLSHTPFGGFGCNFEFEESDPDDRIVDALKTRDRIDEVCTIKARSFRWTVEVDEGVDLNLTANKEGGSVTFDFNYHHAALSAESAETLIRGSVAKYFAHASDLLSTLYGIEEFEILERKLETKTGGEGA